MEQETTNKKKEIVSFFIKRGILVSNDILDALSDNSNVDEIYNKISSNSSSDLVILNNEIKEIICRGNASDIVCREIDKSKVMDEKNRKEGAYTAVIKSIKTTKKEEDQKKHDGIEIINNYREHTKKKEVQDFVSYFNTRFSSIEKILRQRQELQNPVSIGRVLQKKDRETVSVIGLVSDKQITKNGNIVLEIEDTTGTIKVCINKNKPQLFTQANDIVLDEVIGVIGANSDRIIFASQVVWPDVPSKTLKKCEDESYAVFLSDLHVGSNNFLRDEFIKFLQWIRQESGTDTQKAVASKVKYIFIVGDLVDGVGIYPGQENELDIADINDQYAECARLLSMVPENISIIISPGNHDAMRISEPQPQLYSDLAKPVWDLKNAIIVTNPALVKIHISKEFSGFDVLLYHGYSFDHYIANVDSIRNNGGYDRADLVMKYLLQRRHLAPTHKSTLYVPHPEKDYLVIESSPDFFATGHIHKTAVQNYRGITMISGSCWQSKTSFQEKVGHHPEPCRVPVVNLKTREIKILRFG